MFRRLSFVVVAAVMAVAGTLLPTSVAAAGVSSNVLAEPTLCLEPTTTVSGTVTVNGVPVEPGPNLISGTLYFYVDGVSVQQATISNSGSYSTTLYHCGQFTVQGDFRYPTAEPLLNFLGGTFSVPGDGAPVTHDIDLDDLPEFSPPASGRVTTPEGVGIPNVSVTLDGHYAGHDVTGFHIPISSADGGFTLNRLVATQPVLVGVNRQSGRSLYTGRYYAGPGNLGSATAADATPVTGAASAQDLGDIQLDTCGTVRGQVDESLLVGGEWAGVVVFNDAVPDLVTRSASLAADGGLKRSGSHLI